MTEHEITALPRSIRGLQRTFAALPTTGLDTVAGTYRAVFLGPALLRVAAPRAIALGGMPRWYGKRFDEGGSGVNLLRGQGASLEVSLSMQTAVEPSWFDGRPALVVSYGADAPRPWRWVRDEFRILGEDALLGATFVLHPWSRVLAAPFALVREPAGIHEPGPNSTP